jgi:hypothetical protein
MSSKEFNIHKHEKLDFYYSPSMSKLYNCNSVQTHNKKIKPYSFAEKAGQLPRTHWTDCVLVCTATRDKIIINPIRLKSNQQGN